MYSDRWSARVQTTSVAFDQVETLLGQGTVGLELAEAFVKRGAEVTVVERHPHVMGRLDADMGTLVTEACRKEGITVYVSEQVEGIEPLCLGPGDVTGRGTAFRISIFVVFDEGLPVRVTGPFDRVSNLLSGECHGFSLLFTRLDQADWRQRYPVHRAACPSSLARR